MPTAPALPTTTNESSFLPSSYESIRAQALETKAFPQASNVTADAAIIVFSRPDGGKLSPADVRERQNWDDYMKAYEEMIANTSTKHAPWYVVPADNKWYTRVVVAAAIVEALEDLKLAYPKVDASQRKDLNAAKASLLEEKKG